MTDRMPGGVQLYRFQWQLSKPGLACTADWEEETSVWAPSSNLGCEQVKAPQKHRFVARAYLHWTGCV